MATKYTVSERARFGLYLLLNPMQHPNRVERMRADRLFEVLGLDVISSKVDAAGGHISHLGFSDQAMIEVELTSDQRDMMIDFLDRPAVTTSIGRLVSELERELIKRRDGAVGSS